MLRSLLSVPCGNVTRTSFFQPGNRIAPPFPPHLSRKYVANRGLELKNIVTTLRPEHLIARDFIDLSGLHVTCVYLSSRVAKKPPFLEKWNTFIYYKAGVDRKHPPFPLGVHGFFYYHCPPFAPTPTGQVRFRITASSDPSTFNSGTDLLHPSTGLPWSTTLIRMVNMPRDQPVVDLLLCDGLVSHADVRATTQIADGMRKSTIIYAFGQPFYIDFQQRSDRIFILHTQKGQLAVEPVSLQFPRKWYPNYPYTGSAHCCFELINEDTVYLKVLKIITAVDIIPTSNDKDLKHFRMPKEGEPLYYSSAPWHYDIPKEMKRLPHDRRWGLRFLTQLPNVTYDMF